MTNEQILSEFQHLQALIEANRIDECKARISAIIGVVENKIQREKEMFKPQQILTEICNVLEIDKQEVINNKRNRKTRYVEVRQLFYYYMKQLTDASLSEIGRIFFDKDHATVYHSINIINSFYDNDKRIHNIVEELNGIFAIDSKLINEQNQ